MTWQSDMGLPDDWQPPGFQPPDPADPSKGVAVRMPDGSFRTFAPGEVPKTFISDSIPGGWGAAVPGTDEYSHYGRVLATDRNRSIGKMLALAAGAGALSGSFGAAGAAGGAAEGAEALAPITAGASYLPAVAGSTVPYIGGSAAAVGASTGGAMAAFPALGGGAAAGAALPELPTIGGAAAGVPESAVAGTPDAAAVSDAGGSSGGSNMLQRLFHMGGNQMGGGQSRAYRFQAPPAMADVDQQQRAAEMLAEALSKKQSVDPIVRGGPVPVGRY